MVGACAPMLHEQTFRGAVTRAGLNPYLYHHVGLREQDSWVHGHDKQAATDKAIRLMSAGVAKARLLEPLEPIRLDAEKHALVIGGGVAGLRAALDIARQGLRVTLVEKSPFLGGRMAQLDSVFPTEEDARSLLTDLIEEVVAHPNVTIFTQAEVVGVSGYVGNFNIQVRQHVRGVDDDKRRGADGRLPAGGPGRVQLWPDQRKVIYRPYAGCYPATPPWTGTTMTAGRFDVDGWPIVLKDEPKAFELNVGAVVVATGFDPYAPPHGEYGYGEFPGHHPAAVDPPAGPDAGRTAVGVERTPGPRRGADPLRGQPPDRGRPPPQPDGQVNNYCSRVCCTATPAHCRTNCTSASRDLNLYDLHQDIRTYGRGHEDYYRRALEDGVRFLRYHGEDCPVVSAAPQGEAHPLLVTVKDCSDLGRGDRDPGRPGRAGGGHDAPSDRHDLDQDAQDLARQ